MTDAEARALGERWIAAGGGWRPGWERPATGAPDDDGDRGRLDDYQPEYMGRPDGAWPDLRDPATLGAALAVVRERTDPLAYVAPYWSHPGPTLHYHVLDRDGHSLGRGDSEAAALVSAIEAVPVTR